MSVNYYGVVEFLDALRPTLAEQLAADPRAGGAIYASTKRAISRRVRARPITAEWAGAGQAEPADGTPGG